MTQPVCTLELARLRRDRIAKLHTAMETAGAETLVLCGQSNVSYATGARVPPADHMRAAGWRAVVVLNGNEWWPQLYTELPEGAPADVPDEQRTGAIEVESDAGAAQRA